MVNFLKEICFNKSLLDPFFKLNTILLLKKFSRNKTTKLLTKKKKLAPFINLKVFNFLDLKTIIDFFKKLDLSLFFCNTLRLCVSKKLIGVVCSCWYGSADTTLKILLFSLKIFTKNNTFIFNFDKLFI